MEVLQNNVSTELALNKKSYLNNSMFNQQWLKKFNESKWWLSNQAVKQITNVNPLQHNLMNIEHNASSKKTYIFQDLSVTTKSNTNDRVSYQDAVKSPINKVDGHATLLKQFGVNEYNISSFRLSQQVINRIKKLIQPSSIITTHKQSLVRQHVDVSINLYTHDDINVITIRASGQINLGAKQLMQIREWTYQAGFNAHKVVVNGKVVFERILNDGGTSSAETVLDKHY